MVVGCCPYTAPPVTAAVPDVRACWLAPLPWPATTAAAEAGAVALAEPEPAAPELFLVVLTGDARLRIAASLWLAAAAAAAHPCGARGPAAAAAGRHATLRAHVERQRLHPCGRDQHDGQLPLPAGFEPRSDGLGARPYAGLHPGDGARRARGPDAVLRHARPDVGVAATRRLPPARTARHHWQLPSGYLLTDVSWWNTDTNKTQSNKATPRER
mmetsp:Transcript_19258/g.49021  ORF Transcript_19258/g.49021 Transcript_19258/m.49021 type:complete len:214 (+) Transcript_19258:2004-2645(+)